MAMRTNGGPTPLDRRQTASAASRETIGQPPPDAPAAGGTRHGLLRTFWSMVMQRCPRCQKAQIFCGTFAMNDPCPVCGVIFQREEGYFLGALYISYVLGTFILAVFYYLAMMFLQIENGLLLVGVAFLGYVPFIPAVVRYSRVVWIYLDRFGDSYAIPAAGYEEWRRKDLAARAANSPENKR